ncbi:MAG: glycosyltransferase family 2 protein [Muribaculaceae bacterium]
MKFSIITINYNNYDGLRRTIESVVNQTCRDFEYIIIDGGSTDGSVDFIKQYANQINYWVSEPDKGIYNAMNKGVAVAKGEYCLFMNSGDCLYKSNVIHDVLASGLDADVVCGDICFENNNICPNPDSVTMRTFYRGTLYHQASFIRTKMLKQAPYDEELKSAADWKWFVHKLIFDDASYKHVPIVIADFEGGGISENNNHIGKNEVKQELERLFPKRVIADYEDYCVGFSNYRKMTNMVERIPSLKRLLFAVDKSILKILNIKIRAKWISNL